MAGSVATALRASKIRCWSACGNHPQPKSATSRAWLTGQKFRSSTGTLETGGAGNWSTARRGHLESIGFRAPLSEVYAKTRLARR